MVANRSHLGSGLYMTEEQYLALDDATDGKYEFYQGYVIMLSPPSSAYDEHVIIDMAGGSVAHSALCARLASLIDQAITAGPCLAYNSDVKLQITSPSHYSHPDVLAACNNETGQLLTEAVVVIEVLSPATEKRDRHAKLIAYKSLPSIQEYLLVGSESQEIIMYRRESAWRPYHYQSGDVVELKSIGVNFPFDAVYRRIPL